MRTSSYDQRTKTTAWLQVKGPYCKIVAHVVADVGGRKARALPSARRGEKGRSRRRQRKTEGEGPSIPSKPSGYMRTRKKSYRSSLRQPMVLIH